MLDIRQSVASPFNRLDFVVQVFNEATIETEHIQRFGEYVIDMEQEVEPISFQLPIADAAW